MSKAGLLASSVSAFALMCFAVDAHTLMSDPAHPNMQVTPDRIIQSQAATDKYRQRRFNIILKPEAAAAAAAVQNYFNGSASRRSIILTRIRLRCGAPTRKRSRREALLMSRRTPPGLPRERRTS